jgi:putative component of membrane protein insertase Oxa1/YidC/SpoIIIJ protein YidD
MIRFFALLSIKAYQHFVSPHKGYTCAHNALHKKGGCSSRVYRHIQEKPISQWFSLYKFEVGECKIAHDELKKKKSKKNKCCKKEDGEQLCECGSCQPCGKSKDTCDSCDVSDVCSGSIGSC